MSHGKPYPVGRKITGIRQMTSEELEANGWGDHSSYHMPVTVLQLDDGSIIFPMSDEEGNTAGVVVCTRANGDQQYIFAKSPTTAA